MKRYEVEKGRSHGSIAIWDRNLGSFKAVEIFTMMFKDGEARILAEKIGRIMNEDDSIGADE